MENTHILIIQKGNLLEILSMNFQVALENVVYNNYKVFEGYILFSVLTVSKGSSINNIFQ